ncbi:hypothetical protein AB833_29535 [Chromatiales bacterium (ex Bugula neritina AB1)]|nr:hypothetical protein AB833_29535 [Chromatiales bacterium (ex Bugula neritina AB1)]
MSGVVFDKDGTLFGFQEVWGSWCETVLTELAPDNLDLRLSLADAAGYNLMTKAFKPGSLVVNASADETTQAWTDLLPGRSFADVEAAGLRCLADLPLTPIVDLRQLFAALGSAGLKVGVATNDYESVARNQLREVGAEDCVDFICGFDSGFGSKPGSGMIDAFCKQTGCKVEDVAMIGDSTHDLLAGVAAGVALKVGVLTGPAAAEDLSDYSDVVLDDISQLLPWLQNKSLL